MIKKVIIDADAITDWNSFHAVFKTAFEFPANYAKNIEAWIDTMWEVNEGETVLIVIANSDSFRERCEDIYFTLLECAAFVNLLVDGDEDTVIAVALE